MTFLKSFQIRKPPKITPPMAKPVVIVVPSAEVTAVLTDVIASVKSVRVIVANRLLNILSGFFN
jgi:hypothetical protein